MDINPTYNDRVKYELTATDLNQTITIDEPIGWDDDDKELARNENHHGVMAQFSNSLRFIGTGADLIDLADELYGINAELILRKFVKHPRTDRWTKIYWGYLDLATKVKEKGNIAIKFNAGGLEQLIKARESENIEIERADSLDGTLLPPISINEVLLKPRRIFLRSQWEVKPTNNSVFLGVSSGDGNTRRLSGAMPLVLVNQSHDIASSVLQGSEGSFSNGTTGMMILLQFDRTRTINIIGTGLSFKPNMQYLYSFDWAEVSINLTVFENGDEYLVKSRTPLVYINADTTTPNLYQANGTTINIPNFSIPITGNEGDSVAIELLISADLADGGLDNTQKHFYVGFDEQTGKIVAEEDSVFNWTRSKFVLIHDLLDRLVSIAGNKLGLFYSDYFGRVDLGYPVDGPGAYFGTTHGFWIRGFDKLPLSTEDAPNRYKPFTTSINDALESSHAILNVGMGIEEVNGKERVRVEPLSYFYDHNVTIKLPNQVKNVKRSKAMKYYPVSAEVGYQRGGDYSEAQGLDEPNVKSTFTTIIHSGKEVFRKLSIFRADSTGKEFARRKPFSRYSTEDTQYDEDIWWLDLKKGQGAIFEERVWQDDFDTAPTGIFSPETANSLRLSPVNMLLRHGYILAAALTKYPTEYLRYGSSTANSRLKTKLRTDPAYLIDTSATRGNGVEYAENDNILNSHLKRARFVPEYIEFEHECGFDIMQMVQGETMINGKPLPNFYGTVQFINENNEVEKGFLMSLKPNGRGTWKLLKSNR